MFVPGEGNPHATLMFVAEAPGRDEDACGRPLVGASGREYDRFLSSIRIAREDVWTTNLVKERPENNADPDEATIRAHEGYLQDELMSVRPRYVVTLGRFSMRWFLGERASIDREWGIARRVRMCETHGYPLDRCQECAVSSSSTWNVIVIPVHHPAYGLYAAEEQRLIEVGFERVRAVIDGTLPEERVADAFPEPEYVELGEMPGSGSGSGSQTLSPVVACDTEGSVRAPWCLSLCEEPGTGSVVASRNVSASACSTGDTLVVMHYAAHDLEVLAAMGVRVPNYADTMIIAYELGPTYPQALKRLAYRECNMEMRDFDDLLAPYDRAIAVEYLRRVLAERACQECRGRRVVVATTALKNGKTRRSVRKCEACGGDGTSWPKPDALPVWENGKLSVWQPSPIGARVRRILADVDEEKRDKHGELTDVRKRWEDADPPDVIARVEDELGPMPLATLDDAPRDEVIAYAARDADATLRVWQKLDPELDRLGLRETYNTDLAILPMVVRMQQVGMLIDRAHFAQLCEEWTRECQQITHKLARLVGYYVNPGSSKQVANLLFVKMRLGAVRKTKSKLGESTDDKVLEQLMLNAKPGSIEREVLTLIKRHRELHKLRGTYGAPLATLTSADSRVRTEIKTTRTATGRLSSSKPRGKRERRGFLQLQNVPTRSDEGKRIREGFIAAPGKLLGEWDLSQIEWRVMAHVTRDPGLIGVFTRGEDLHVATAASIWEVPLDQVTPKQRSSAKNIGFAMGYKVTEHGIRNQFALRGIDITLDEARMFRAKFLATYPGIEVFWENTFAEARRNGYVRSLDGRIKWATAARCTASWVREEALREIANFPIQAYAAHVLKRIMIRVWERVLPRLRAAGVEIECVLQVHDSLIFEFDEGEGDEAVEMVDTTMKHAMRTSVELCVPVLAEGKWGRRWSELK